MLNCSGTDYIINYDTRDVKYEMFGLTSLEIYVECFSPCIRKPVSSK